MLKDVVVVSSGIKYYFEGKDIKVHNTDKLLLIDDENKQIAVFQVWELWRELAKDEIK